MLPVRMITGSRKSWGNFIAATAILIPLVFAIMSYRISLMPVNAPKADQITVVVPKQATTSTIAGILKSSGVIRNASAFRLYARMEGVDGKLKPGTYIMNTAMTVPEITWVLVKGPADRIKLTIPEGYTVAQIAGLLEQKGLSSRAEFTNALNQNWQFSFLKQLPDNKYNLEGYLFPDTYFLGPGSGPDKIVEMMLQNFEQVMERNDYINKARAKGLSLNEAVTVASMVEREARVESERPRIAGVIYNRLKAGMPLQIDATVQYALGKQKEKLLYSDLEINSPYNTYKIYGLPPGPIANPGWPSLKAAIEPEKNDYLYYCAKPDGSHAFARTLAEHNKNVQKYQ
ncbi:endolytic transglycosylase MltG [Desulfotruncus alcoholivorax]|uniref:endolytic transglycosylase MltG n=1 Tax=Desulfotruncus alcoholivorax TaxID=265477 RepID=UPI0003FE57FC|nr:endolytic transglycosylase MltG [Desulfotruncus alcoholivorax]